MRENGSKPPILLDRPILAWPILARHQEAIASAEVTRATIIVATLITLILCGGPAFAISILLFRWILNLGGVP